MGEESMRNPNTIVIHMVLTALLMTIGSVKISASAFAADIYHPQASGLVEPEISFRLVAEMTEKEPLGMVKSPTTSIKLLQNIKFVLDKDLLMHKEFYTAENLDRFFGAQGVSSGGSDAGLTDLWVRAKNFGYLVKSTKNDEYVFSGISFSSGIKSKAGGKVSSFVNLGIGLGGPSFDDVESVFGKEWTLDKTAPLHGPPPAPIAPHGNERLTYTFDDDLVERRLVVQFHGNGLIYIANLSVETR
jgi:hypothetical protein